MTHIKILSFAVPPAIIAIAAFYFFSSAAISSTPTYVSECVQKNKICIPTNFPYQNAALSANARVDDLLARMTNAEKFGQMSLIEKGSVHDLNDITKYGLGGLLSGGGGKPETNTPEGWVEMIETFQHQSQQTRLRIPLLYGVDAVHGHSNVPGATIFPHFIGLAAGNDAELVRAVAKATAEEVTATGVNWVYSPNLDIVQDMRWGRTYETFGSDPELIGRLGHAYIEGLQSIDENRLSVAATAKHFIGNGSMRWGSSANGDYFIDQGESFVSEQELRKTHLAPFKQAIDANVKSIMVGLNKWDGENVSINKYLLTDVLRTELGFQGLVVSDWYAVHDDYNFLVSSINAGIDMIMLPYDYKFFSDSMHTAVANGDIKQSRVDEAVRRILKVKFETKLFDQKQNLAITNVGSQAHRDIARIAVRKSLVLLKNNKVLPIPQKTSKILVAGSAADNLGKQSGGWTVEWQGVNGNVIPGTTILKGLRERAPRNTKVFYELSGKFQDQKDLADIGIAIVGENPYAEGWGDNENPKLSEDDIATINNLKKNSKKIVVIIISGRPLDIKKYVSDWDGVVAAWLPGSEGQGVADVLFGDYDFTGTLPVVW